MGCSRALAGSAWGQDGRGTDGRTAVSLEEEVEGFIFTLKERGRVERGSLPASEEVVAVDGQVSIGLLHGSLPLVVSLTCTRASALAG